jgi:lysyl-tRNA synthetase class II
MLLQNHLHAVVILTGLQKIGQDNGQRLARSSTVWPDLRSQSPNTGALTGKCHGVQQNENDDNSAQTKQVTLSRRLHNILKTGSLSFLPSQNNQSQLEFLTKRDHPTDPQTR